MSAASAFDKKENNMNEQEIAELLRSTAQQLPEKSRKQALALLIDAGERTPLAKDIAEEMACLHGGDGADSRRQADAFQSGMADCLENISPYPYRRQVYWNLFQQWLVQLGSYFNIIDFPDPDWAEKPILEEPAVTLLKALHARAGVTKAELCDKLHVSDRTVQDMLRAVSPALREKNAPEAAKRTLRFGGQQIRGEIECKKNAHEPWRFSMTNTIHPIAVQWNVMQVYEVLFSLYDSYNKGLDLCRTAADDIYAQLSDYVKERIHVVAADDSHFLNFLKDLEADPYAERLFMTEREMIRQKEVAENLSVEEAARFAVKGLRRCNVHYQKKGSGQEFCLENQCIVYRYEGGGLYLLPAESCQFQNGPPSEAFCRDHGILVQIGEITQIDF